MRNRKLAASIAATGAALLLLTACSSSTETATPAATTMETTTPAVEPTEATVETATPAVEPTETGPDYSIKSSGGGTEQDSYITVGKNTWFAVPQPIKVAEGVDFGMKVDFDKTLIERPTGLKEVPQDLIDNPPLFGAVGNESNGLYKSLDKAGKTVITTTFTGDKGETVIWKMKVTVK